MEDATISLYNSLGILYATKGDTQKAHQYFMNNLKLSDKPGFANSHVESLIYLGEFFLANGEIEKALGYFEKGLAIVKEKNMPEMESNILFELAQITMEKDPERALAYLDTGRQLCEIMHNKLNLVTIYKEEAQIYKMQGKFEAALNATELKEKIADSIFNINKVKEIASITSGYEFEKSKDRIKQLEILNKKNATERNALIAVGISIVLILLVLVIYFRKTLMLNRKLKKREKELEETNSMKDKLFSIIGHDLRAPLARIPAILDIYEDPETTEEEKKFMFYHLKEHTKASLETLDKLLYWGHSLMKGIRINQVKMPVKPLIRENIDLIKIKAQEKEITIKDNIPNDLNIFADPAHFDFIIRNLLANALKYTYPRGVITLSADNNHKQAYTLFSVADNGMGINTDRMSLIFNPLVSTAGTEDEKGTGIGLMLCKEFVIKNGGEIWVESQPGKGATFFFSLKRYEENVGG
jgi:signal transduction histidine kinase